MAAFITQDIAWANPQESSSVPSQSTLQIPTVFQCLRSDRVEIVLKAKLKQIIETMPQILKEKRIPHLLMDVDGLKIELLPGKPREEGGNLIIKCGVSTESSYRRYEALISPDRSILITKSEENVLKSILEKNEASQNGPSQKSPIIEKFKELSKKYGGKAAWLMVIKEIGLAEKFDFLIPEFSNFDRDYLNDLAKRYKDSSAKDEFSKLRSQLIDDLGLNASVAIMEELYAKPSSERESKELIEEVLNTKLKSLLEYAPKEEWIKFLYALRKDPDIERLRIREEVHISFIKTAILMQAIDSFEDALESFIFFRSLPETMQKEWKKKQKSLPRHFIWRSSTFDEDTFETSKAGVYVSRIASIFTALNRLSSAMDTPRSLITSDFIQGWEYNVFPERYIIADKGGVAFSNLCGYTTIEAVVGGCDTAVKGIGTTIIDLNRIDGRFEDVNYGFGSRPGQYTWNGVDLDCAKGNWQDWDQVMKLWDSKMGKIKVKGKVKKSPLTQAEIQRVRNVVVNLEEELGFPVDVEFVFKGRKLYILQVRPITGENSPLPAPLPEFKKEDIIAHVPISIGALPPTGFQGHIVGKIDVDELQFSDQGGKTTTYPLDEILRQIQLDPERVILAVSDPITLSRNFPKAVYIDTRKASRIYHCGIELREKGVVVAGMPGIMEAETSPIEWVEKEFEILPEHKKLYLKVSKYPVRYYSNGFRGILVKADAMPIKVEKTKNKEKLLKPIPDPSPNGEAGSITNLKTSPSILDKRLNYFKVGGLIISAEKTSLDIPYRRNDLFEVLNKDMAMGSRFEIPQIWGPWAPLYDKADNKLIIAHMSRKKSGYKVLPDYFIFDLGINSGSSIRRDRLSYYSREGAQPIPVRIPVVSEEQLNSEFNGDELVGFVKSAMASARLIFYFKDVLIRQYGRFRPRLTDPDKSDANAIMAKARLAFPELDEDEFLLFERHKPWASMADLVVQDQRNKDALIAEFSRHKVSVHAKKIASALISIPKLKHKKDAPILSLPKLIVLYADEIKKDEPKYYKFNAQQQEAMTEFINKYRDMSGVPDDVMSSFLKKVQAVINNIVTELPQKEEILRQLPNRFVYVVDNAIGKDGNATGKHAVVLRFRKKDNNSYVVESKGFKILPKFGSTQELLQNYHKTLQIVNDLQKKKEFKHFLNVLLRRVNLFERAWIALLKSSPEKRELAYERVKKCLKEIKKIVGVAYDSKVLSKEEIMALWHPFQNDLSVLNIEASKATSAVENKNEASQNDTFQKSKSVPLSKNILSQCKAFDTLETKIIHKYREEGNDISIFCLGKKILDQGIYWPSKIYVVASILNVMGVTPDDAMLEVGGADAALSCCLSHIFNITATSVEIYPPYHEYATFLRDNLIKKNYIKEGQVKLINQNFTDKNIDFSKYSLIYYFALGTKTKQGLLDKMLTVKEGARILIYGEYEPEIEDALALNPAFKTETFDIARLYTKQALVRQQNEGDVPQDRNGAGGGGGIGPGIRHTDSSLFPGTNDPLARRDPLDLALNPFGKESFGRNWRYYKGSTGSPGNKGAKNGTKSNFSFLRQLVGALKLKASVAKLIFGFGRFVAEKMNLLNESGNIKDSYSQPLFSQSLYEELKQFTETYRQNLRQALRKKLEDSGQFSTVAALEEILRDQLSYFENILKVSASNHYTGNKDTLEDDQDVLSLELADNNTILDLTQEVLAKFMLDEIGDIKKDIENPQIDKRMKDFVNMSKIPDLKIRIPEEMTNFLNGSDSRRLAFEVLLNARLENETVALRKLSEYVSKDNNTLAGAIENYGELLHIEYSFFKARREFLTPKREEYGSVTVDKALLQLDQDILASANDNDFFGAQKAKTYLFTILPIAVAAIGLFFFAPEIVAYFRDFMHYFSSIAPPAQGAMQTASIVPLNSPALAIFIAVSFTAFVIWQMRKKAAGDSNPSPQESLEGLYKDNSLPAFNMLTREIDTLHILSADSITDDSSVRKSLRGWLKPEPEPSAPFDGVISTLIDDIHCPDYYYLLSDEGEVEGVLRVGPLPNEANKENLYLVHLATAPWNRAEAGKDRKYKRKYTGLEDKIVIYAFELMIDKAGCARVYLPHSGSEKRVLEKAGFSLNKQTYDSSDLVKLKASQKILPVRGKAGAGGISVAEIKADSNRIQQKKPEGNQGTTLYRCLIPPFGILKNVSRGIRALVVWLINSLWPDSFWSKTEIGFAEERLIRTCWNMAPDELYTIFPDAIKIHLMERYQDDYKMQYYFGHIFFELGEWPLAIYHLKEAAGLAGKGAARNDFDEIKEIKFKINAGSLLSALEARDRAKAWKFLHRVRIDENSTDKTGQNLRSLDILIRKELSEKQDANDPGTREGWYREKAEESAWLAAEDKGYSPLVKAEKLIKGNENIYNSQAYELSKLYVRRGNALCNELRMYPEALWAYEIAASLDPSNDLAFEGIGYALSCLALNLPKSELQNNYEKQREAYEKAVRLNPVKASYYFNLGNALYKLHKFDLAEESYQKCINLDTEDDIYWYNFGTALYALNKFDLAAEAYQKCINLNPEDDAYWHNLGAALTMLGKYEEGKQAYERAIRFNPNRAMYFNDLGDVLCNLHQYEEAEKNFKKALELNPDDSLTKEKLLNLQAKLKERPFVNQKDGYNPNSGHYIAPLPRLGGNMDLSNSYIQRSLQYELFKDANSPYIDGNKWPSRGIGDYGLRSGGFKAFHRMGNEEKIGSDSETEPIRFLRNIVNPEELTQNTIEAILSELFSNRRVGLAFDSNLKGLKLQRVKDIKKALMNWKEATIRNNPKMQKILDNLIIFEYNSLDGLSIALSGYNLDPKDIKNNTRIFAFTPRLDASSNPANLGSAVRTVVMEGEGEFREGDYYPLLEVITLTLVKDVMDWGEKELRENLRNFDGGEIRYEELGINEITEDENGRVLIFKMLPKMSRYNSKDQVDRYTRLLQFLHSA